MQIIERQGSTIYVALALDELGLKYIDHVSEDKRVMFKRRVAALALEDL